MKRLIPLFALLLSLGLSGCFLSVEDDEKDPHIVTFLVGYDAGDFVYDDEVAYVEFDAPEITRDVHDYGAVLAFYEIGGTWFGMPFTNGYDFDLDGETDEVIEFTYASEPGTFILYFITSGPELMPEDVLEGRVKVAVIPPAYYGRGKQQLKYNTWEEAREALGLIEPTVERRSQK